MTKVAGFSEVLAVITSSLHLSVVENIENTASLYGCSISNHHICLLVKEAVGTTIFGLYVAVCECNCKTVLSLYVKPLTHDMYNDDNKTGVGFQLGTSGRRMRYLTCFVPRGHVWQLEIYL